MSISKTRIKSAVIKQNDTNTVTKIFKGSTNATNTLDSNNNNKVSPKNGQNKILPISSSSASTTACITNNMGIKAIKSSLNLQNSLNQANIIQNATTLQTTTTILPQAQLLKIEPFVPNHNARLQKPPPIRRSYSTLANTTLKKRIQQQQHTNLDVKQRGGGAGGGGAAGGVAANNMVTGLPKVLKQPTPTLRRRPTLRGPLNRQRSKSTSSSNSNSNRPNTAAVTNNSTPSLGTPCSSPYAAVVIQQPNGICRIQRNAKEQEKLPDRINYDKRGLTAIPIFENETNLRLLSLQHNLINTFHIPKQQQDEKEEEQEEEKEEVRLTEENLKLKMETDVRENVINLLNPSHSYNKQRLPMALTAPNVDNIPPAQQMQQQQQQQQQQFLLQNFHNLQNSTNPLILASYNNNNNLKRNNVIQKSLQSKQILQQQPALPSPLRFGIRRSQSFINNFNLQLNLTKRTLHHQRTVILRKSQGQGNLKSFDSSTSNLTTDSTNSTLISNEMLEEDLAQGEEEEGNSYLSELEIKNKQLIINYGVIFQNLVFLDLYDNQIEKISNLDGLSSLTVLLLGKNRISDISGLCSLKLTLRVLDLHGNKLCSIANKINCLKELKSLNLAGNQIRQINHNDFLDLKNLKELNLKRNKLKRINGFQHLVALERLWLCHNDLHKVDDMSSIAKAFNLIEITIENNPLTLAGDCVSFLVSYLPKLQSLSQMPITEQVRKAAMSWRSNKELSEANSQHTNKEVFNIIRREEIISNARTNWELLRSQQMVQTSLKQQKLSKPTSDLEKISEANEHNYEEFIKLPPIESKQQKEENSSSCLAKDEERSSSASSLGPNVNSSSSCYSSQDEDDCRETRTKENSHLNNDQLSIQNSNNKIVSSSSSSSLVKSKQQTDQNHTSNDNNHQVQHLQQLKCNSTTIRTPSSSAIALTTTSSAATLNLQFPMENNKVSANQQNQTVIANATSVSSLTGSIQTAAGVSSSTNSSSSSSYTTSVTQASTYSKRYMTGSLMRSQTIVGTVTGGASAAGGSGVVGGSGGSGITSGYTTVKTNNITTTNNIRYQSKLNPNAGNSTTQTSALAQIHQQQTTTATLTTGYSLVSTAAAAATNSNNLMSSISSSSSSSMHGHNMSLTLNSNKTSTLTTTSSSTTFGNSTATTGSSSCGATSTKLTAIEREREQGGDYLIEICGRYLNIYGQGALRFIDKQWNPTKANDVHTLNFSYINFNNIASILSRIKVRFPHAENFVFRETNINSLGQLNALAELQGIASLTIDVEGNPITTKDLWRQYAIYRLSHWGLKILNGTEVTEKEIENANNIYAGLSDLILWSMPDAMLQPLLTRLRLDESCTASKMLPKQWLQKPDNKSLRLVVGKEALQWKKSNNQEQHNLPTPQQVRQLQNQYYCNNLEGNQTLAASGISNANTTTNPTTSSAMSSLSSLSTTTTSLTTRERGKIHFTLMMENTCNAVEKLHKLDQLWPTMLLSIVRNTLLDYSQLDVYIRNLMAEIMK